MSGNSTYSTNVLRFSYKLRSSFTPILTRYDSGKYIHALKKNTQNDVVFNLDLPKVVEW